MLFAHGAETTFDFTPTAMFGGAALRAAQALAEAAPYLLLGTLLAGVLRGMVEPAALRRSFGGTGVVGCLRAWGLALLLPVCSFSVLPVAQELRRAGVRTAPLLTFLLAAPVLNPLSLVYGLTLLPGAQLLAVVVLTLIISAGTGLLCDWLNPEQVIVEKEQAEPLPSGVTGRLATAGLGAMQAWADPVVFDLSVGLLGVALLGALLPHGGLLMSLAPGNVWATPLMTLVAWPAYVTPLTSMMQAGSLVQDGFSRGAALSILVLGAGINMGTLSWIARTFTRKTASWLALIVTAFVLALGVGADLLARQSDPLVDHTHILDDYSRPTVFAAGPANFAAFPAQLRAKGQVNNLLVVALLGSTTMVGWLLRRYGVRIRADRVPNAQPAARPESVWNRPLPGRWLAALSVIGGLGGLVGLVYVLFPPPADLFADLTTSAFETNYAVRHQPVEEGLELIRRQQDLARKLPIAAVLRQGRLSAEQRLQTDEMVYSINALAEAVAEGKREEAVTLLRYVRDATANCRRAFLPGEP